MLQTLLDNNTLHERIAEKINKAIDSSRESRNIKTNGEKIVETVLHSTESDPIFDELARMLAGMIFEIIIYSLCLQTCFD